MTPAERREFHKQRREAQQAPRKAAMALLKVGDEVATSPNTQVVWIGTIKTIKKTEIITSDGRRWRPDTGKFIGRGDTILVIDPASIAQAKQHKKKIDARRRAASEEAARQAADPHWQAADRLLNIFSPCTTDNIKDRYTLEQLQAALAALGDMTT